MPARHPKPFAAALIAVLLTAACSGGGTKKATPSPTPSPTSSPTPTVSPTPTTDPLTGLDQRSTAPLVGVKIDNAVLARPFHAGLGRAALVYEELVEGGSTRLLGVYESDLAGPGEVGPIRSFRESDVELVRGFGKMTIAFSGGNTGVKAIVRQAARNGWLVDGSYDAIPAAYRMGAHRRDANNFFAVPAKVASRRPGDAPKDIGFTFGVPVPGGLPATTAIAAYSPETRVTVHYDATAKTWSVAQNGRVMPGVAPANVIIQRVIVRSSGFADVHGMRTPYTITVGGGPVTVLRDGLRYSGTWLRRGHGATRYLDVHKQDIPLRPGRTWILLLPTRGNVSFS